MCTLLEANSPMRNRDREIETERESAHTSIALIGVNKYCIAERDKPT